MVLFIHHLSFHWFFFKLRRLILEKFIHFMSLFVSKSLLSSVNSFSFFFFPLLFKVKQIHIFLFFQQFLILFIGNLFVIETQITHIGRTGRGVGTVGPDRTSFWVHRFWRSFRLHGGSVGHFIFFFDFYFLLLFLPIIIYVESRGLLVFDALDGFSGDWNVNIFWRGCDRSGDDFARLKGDFFHGFLWLFLLLFCLWLFW